MRKGSNIISSLEKARLVELVRPDGERLYEQPFWDTYVLNADPDGHHPDMYFALRLQREAELSLKDSTKETAKEARKRHVHAKGNTLADYERLKGIQAPCCEVYKGGKGPFHEGTVPEIVSDTLKYNTCLYTMNT